MPVELRKRKAHQQPTEAAPPAKKKSTVAKAADKVKKAIKGDSKKDAAANPEPKKTDTKKAAAPKNAAVKKDGKVAPGDVVDLEGFGGDIETNDGEKTTLKELVDESEAGVVLFTYPKASTPGCTTQVCLFRDSYKPLTAGGLKIYGLSADSPKANTTFKMKQKLPYPLLCDKERTLIGAIGLTKAGGGTQRGVFVVDKAGKVQVAEAGGPAGTLERVKKLVEEGA